MHPAQFQLRDCPDTLYRYILPPYDARLLEKGETRICLLGEYRNINDGARRDENEGAPNGHCQNSPGDLAKAASPSIAEKYGGDCDDHSNHTYCLSFSMKATCRLAEKFSDPDHGQNARCIRFANAPDLLRRLDAAMREQVAQMGFKVLESLAAPVVYQDETNPESACHCDPRLVKDADDHEDEAEYRVLWTVNDGGVPPELFIRVEDVQDLLQVVRL